MLLDSLCVHRFDDICLSSFLTLHAWKLKRSIIQEGSIGELNKKEKKIKKKQQSYYL